jgi:membrane-bound ClpP family serine protease
VALLTAILVAVFVVPSPWDLPVIAAGAIWEVGESVLWIRWSQRRRAQVGAESLVGATGRVVSSLAPTGHVQLKGELWTARRTGAETVEAGRRVRVLTLEGLMLVVEPLPDEVSPPQPAAQSRRAEP